MAANAMKENVDIACYFITKHSWKGKYKRVFSIGTRGITTYNPSNFEVTNQWSYDEFVNIAPNIKAPSNNEFIITVLKPNRKTDHMRFSTDHRPDLITEALRFRHKFAESSSSSKRFGVYKYHWSDNRVPLTLEVNPGSLDQIDPGSGRLLCSYDYKDMEGLIQLTDYPGGVALMHGGFNRLHLFALEQRAELIKAIQETAANQVGISIKQKKDPITFDQFTTNRFGKYSDDEALTSYVEFTVQKLSPRHLDPVRRTLCLTETCLVERDPATYNVATVKPLCDIFAIVRDQKNPQQFSVEYVKGAIRTYTSTDRDALIASVLDGVRASGNKDVHVKMSFTSRGHRLGPFTVPVDEEVESQHMKFIQQLPAGMSFGEAVSRFNSNVSYSGLLHAVTADGLFAENKEKLINGTLAALLEREGHEQSSTPAEQVEAQFQALRRLVASKAGFGAFTKLPKDGYLEKLCGILGFVLTELGEGSNPLEEVIRNLRVDRQALRMREKVGVKVVKALKRNDDGVTHSAIDMLSALMQPMHGDYDIRQEQLNKASIMSSKTFLERLLEMFRGHVLRNSGALVITAMLDFLTFALCAPYSETTDSAYFDSMLELVADDGRVIFKLFQHPSMAIVKGAGMVMRAVIEEGEAEIAAKMQELALAEGALPRHLHVAMFTHSNDARMLAIRQLSRHLVGLWVTGHPTAMALLKRIMPSGLLVYLDSKEEPPDDDADRINIRDNLKLAQEHENRRKRNIHWKQIEQQVETFLLHWKDRISEKIGVEQKPKESDKPIVLRKRRERIKSEANWKLFYYMFNIDHAKPDLIWNFKTREELRNALEDELRAFNVDRDLSNNFVISWNHQEFEVFYNCLSDEIKIGDYFLRILLEEDDTDETSEYSSIKKSYEFFNDLYHRFLLTAKTNMKCMCLQAMSIVYGRCYEDIGAFNDTRYIVQMLERCADRLERDRLVLFINKLIMHPKNVRQVMEANGVKILVDLLTLAHLHTSRATVPMQTQMIEASKDTKIEGEKEWYFGNADKERRGPYSFEEMKEFWSEGVVNPKTRCWAQGMDGWRPVAGVPQLKWELMATGQAVLNGTDLATLVLNMLIRMCEYYPSRDSDGAIIRPLPKIKRLLSESTYLPHLVQLLLTFDPVLVEKVSTLMYLVMQDNPALSRLYLSGIFFFIMMYTGGNVLPLAKFLKYTHLRQAFRSEEKRSSDIMQRSVIGHILPEAMVCYLENYEPEKFAQIFLGEFDTPEAIWSNEMRRLMIEKIASHLADFSPRLKSNTRALYQYCPIPVISYPQLEHELFCNIYYLRHLCDINKFPDWPIKDPVKLLKDILEAWKAEVEKKPPSMSISDAYDVLHLPKGEGGHDEAKIRKAYFKLAQKYHPDKNPDGRDMFEKVNEAYEFLCSKKKLMEGPDPKNIVLILKAQSILFKRYKEELAPYKYAGYPALVKTINLETHDDALFGKAAPILTAACELAYHTVNCSALNAEELRRENGIETLQAAFSRCVATLSGASKHTDMAVLVSENVARCYAVAAQFEGCREKIQEIQSIVKDLCRILYFKHLSHLCSVVTECVSSLCIDFWLQTHMHQCGVLWHLLLFLFNYDFTLEEGGVDRSTESNQQEVSNRLAKLSVFACARLGGYINGEFSTPDNPAVKKSLHALLTPYLSRKLAENKPEELLKVLNSNTENPYLIWDNATRAELVDFLSDQQQQKVKTGECDPAFGSEFHFSVHEKELIIGEVFVRIYNEQPSFTLENPKGFTLDLLDYLGSQAQYLHSLMALKQQQEQQMAAQPAGNSMQILQPQLQNSHNGASADRLRSVEMALEALRNVIRSNPGVEIQCIGHYKLLFSLLRVDDCSNIQQYALEVISCMTGNQECVNDIAASEVLAYLLMVLENLPASRQIALETLYPLTSNTKLLKEALNKGALIYLIDLYCNAQNPQLRTQTAELFAKVLSDKLVGPKVRIILSKFLPSIFMDAMRDSAEASVHMFEGCHENPELIWNDDAREKVCAVVKRMKDQFYQKQRANAEVRWSIPEEFSVVYTNIQGELTVGGVFLRLFITNPGWVLRKPKEFVMELLEKWSELVGKQNPDGEVLETVTTATAGLFAAQQNLLELVPQLGYIPKIFRAMSSRNDAIPKSCLQIAHQLTFNEACVRTMASTDCVGQIQVAMKCRRDMTGIACEAYMKMFESDNESLVEQALKTQTVEYLVSLLDERIEGVESQAATKAQVVNALKAMQRSLEYGEQVTSVLEKFPVWKQYKDQRHDLFLSDTPSGGYLAGPSVAGYLTAGKATSPSVPDIPPPM